MSEKRLRNYTVDVRETRVFWDTIEVQASSAEEACELAVELQLPLLIEPLQTIAILRTEHLG